MSGFTISPHATVHHMVPASTQQTGSADIPLLLLPGTLCDERVFQPLRERLPGIETRVLLTTRATSMVQAAEQVFTEAPDRFAVLGFSLGGMIAMEMALLAPERICGLANISATPLPVPEELHEGRLAAIQEARSIGVGTFVRINLWSNYCGSQPKEALLPLIVDMAEYLGCDVFAKQTALALSRSDFRQRLRALKCPTLMLAGDEDRICTDEAQKALTAAIPQGKSVSIRGAGHLVLLEKPDESAQAVSAWLETVKQEDARKTTSLRGTDAFKEHG